MTQKEYLESLPDEELRKELDIRRKCLYLGRASVEELEAVLRTRGASDKEDD